MNEMNSQRNNRKKLLLTLIPVLVLVVAVVGVTYAFFNYTRAGSDNSIGTGRINFVSTQSGTTSISNYFPQIPGGAQAEQSSLATISVTGGTTFSGGINYYVKLIDVKVGNRAYNPETDVPVNIDVGSYTSLNDTTNNHGTFTPEGTNNSGVGIALSEGVIIANGTIGVADTAANSDNWINGTFTVQAYIPSNVAISDTTGEFESTAYVNGTTTEWVAERRVFTTAQWNALSANPVTFKIQVVANEGKLPNTMSLSSDSGTIYVGENTTATINTTGDGAKTCSTSDNTKATCSINENTLTINGVAAGTATITVNQAASAGYTAASATYTATVVPPFRGTASQLASSASLYGLETTDYGKIYTGANPDNYVTFNGEQWRIIGVYNNQLKIVRATPLTQTRKYNADENKGNAWSGSDLEIFLNGDYYNGVASQGLTETARGMIAEGTWNAGATTDTATANTAYQAATGTQVSKNVGLIATYEYLYAAGNTCRDIEQMSYTTCSSQDWLKPSSNVWTLSPMSGYNSSCMFVNVTNGSVYSANLTSTFGVSPAVYLKSTVTITGGTGESGANAYTLSYTAS